MNCGPNNFLPPSSNCGPGPNWGPGQGPMGGPQFGPGPPQFNGLGPCGPGMPSPGPPSNCGPPGPPPSHFRGQSPPGRPGSSGPPFPFGPGPNGPCGPNGPPHCGPPGPHGPHQFLGPGPPGPHNFGPHGPGFGPPHGPMGPHGPMHGPPPHFMDRRPMPMLQPDYKIFEMNKRLQQRTDDSDNLWWDAFANEFFEDEAQLTLTFCLEDGPKRYTVGRTLIPRFFRSIFEGGVTELHWELRHAKESFHQAVVSLDCDQATMVTQHGKPMFTKVYTEGRLIVEFNFDDLMRIRSWHFAIRNHRELIPRSVIAMQEPGMVETLSKNITRQGLTATTLNYLRLCVILEPMQELMSRHKAYALNPRDCLKTTLFQKWQKMVAPPEATKPANKRRKRKGSQAAGGGVGLSKKGASPRPNFSLASQDVMVVGEPSLMGGEFGEEDERLISRLENSQYDPAGLGHPGPPLDNPSMGVMGATHPGQGPNSWTTPEGRGPGGPLPPPSSLHSGEMELKRSPPS